LLCATDFISLRLLGIDINNFTGKIFKYKHYTYLKFCSRKKKEIEERGGKKKAETPENEYDNLRCDVSQLCCKLSIVLLAKNSEFRNIIQAYYNSFNRNMCICERHREKKLSHYVCRLAPDSDFLVHG